MKHKVNIRLAYLYENSEYNDGDWGRDKQVPSVDRIGQGEGQGEADGPSQASVGESELVLQGELDGTERVDDLGQHQDACRTENDFRLINLLID